MRRLLAWGILLLVILPTASARSEEQSNGTKKDAAAAGPKLVLIIRHAEKPDDAKDANDPNLSKQGFERARALLTVIPKEFARPDFLIATKKSSHSNRPIETIEPLADSLHLKIEASFKNNEYAALAHELLSDPKYSGKIVLIAWHHGRLPQLAHALGAADAPASWDSRQFDRVWEITYDHGGARFTNLPQKALPGDSRE
jgi:phosphohistidine phosphatase SixA